jgi:hypothetical protein
MDDCKYRERNLDKLEKHIAAWNQSINKGNNNTYNTEENHSNKNINIIDTPLNTDMAPTSVLATNTTANFSVFNNKKFKRDPSLQELKQYTSELNNSKSNLNNKINNSNTNILGRSTTNFASFLKYNDDSKIHKSIFDKIQED